MGQKHSLDRQWRSGANAFRKEEPTSLMIEGLEGRSHAILLRQFSQCSQNDHFCRVKLSVGTSALERRHACESFTMISGWQYSIFIGFHTHLQQTRRAKEQAIQGNSCHIRTTVAHGLWTYYNRRWVLVLFIQSSRLSLGRIQRYASWTDQTKNWHRKVSDFRILVR
jgi:hypothetical protein